MSADPSDIQAQLDALNRRRQMAEAMASQTAQPEAQQVIGGRVMPQGIAPLIRGVTSLLAQGRANRATRDIQNLQQQQTSGVNQAITDYQNAAPEDKPAALQTLQRRSLPPQTLAQSIIQSATAPKNPIILKKEETAFDPVTHQPIPGMTGANPPEKPDQPLDELAKLTADLRAGRISQEDFNLRRTLMTTRAPNMYSDTGNPAETDSMAKAIAKYQLAPPSPQRMQTPQGKALLSKVLEINPDYQAEEFPARSKAYKDFASGKQGDQIRAFNVGISHLNTAQQMADALNNGDVPLFNKVSQFFSQQTGNPAPTNFETAKQVVKGEIVKAVVGGQASQHDREEALAGIDKAASPAQLKGAIATAQALMGGQLGGLKRQFENSTGRKDFERLMSPDALPFLQTKEATGDKNFVPKTEAPQAAIDHLKAHPELADQFKAKYGYLPSG